MTSEVDRARAAVLPIVYSVHLIIRASLDDAVRRGLVSRNVAAIARAPKQRSLQRTEGTALTDAELRRLLRTAAGHRFFPILWLTAMTGMRRGEVLGLKWPDIDLEKRRLHLNRGLVAVGYEVQQTRGKTKSSRRTISLDRITLDVLDGWHSFEAAEFAAVGIDTASSGYSPTATETRSIRTPSTKRSVGSCTTPTSRGSGSTTFATPTGACSSRKVSP